MSRKVIISIIIITTGVLFIVLHFKYNWFIPDKKQAIEAVPEHAAFIIECKTTQSSWKKFETTTIWKDLTKQKYLQKLNLKYKSLDLLISSHEGLNDLVTNNSLVVSIHPTKLNDFDFLYLINLPSYEGETYVNNLISDILRYTPKTSIRKFDNLSIYEMEVEDIAPEKMIFSYGVSKGIFMGSFSSFLVEDAVRKLEHPEAHPLDTSFTLVKNAAGTKVDANVYINFKMLPKFFTTYVSSQNYGMFEPLKTFASWSEMDLKIKDESLMLNGFTSSKDSVPNYMNMFLNQKPHKVEVTKVLPSNTAIILYFGLNDFKIFFEDYLKYTSTTNFDKVLSAPINFLKQEYNISITDEVIPWIGDEYAIAFTENSSVEHTLEPIAIVNTQNTEEAKKSRNLFVEKINKTFTKDNEDSLTKNIKDPYRGYTISYLNLPSLLPLVFGDVFKPFKTPYFAILEDYIVFTTQLSTLQNIIDAYLSENTLSKHPYYVKFTENISAEANLYLYVNSSRSINLLKEFATETFNSQIDENLQYFKKFDQIAYQLSGSKNMFYSNLHIQYTKTIKEDTRLLWKIPLNDEINMQPQIVLNHNTNEKEILVQDKSNILYLINNKGNIIWRIKLDSPVKSKIQQIDYFKNKKLQFVFNTENHIHIIDRNGQKINNFPLKLTSAATCPLSVFDYDNNKDYRFFIACGNSIYGYKKDGTLLNEWGPKKLSENIIFPIQHFFIEGKDYLLTSSVNGDIQVMDRKGNTRIKVKSPSSLSANPCIINKGSSLKTTSITCTDSTGTVYSIYLDGNVYSFKFKDWSSSHYFDCQIAGNNKKYIFFDDSKLCVYNKDTIEVFSQLLKAQVTGRPQYFKLGNDEGKIGLASFLDNQLFLFNENGTIYNSFPLKGGSAYSISDLSNDGSYKLISGSIDHFLYCYSVK